MLGAIIGDVAGSTYEIDEVNALKEKRDNFLNKIKILDKETPLFNSNSSYTDDSILTAAPAGTGHYMALTVLTDSDVIEEKKIDGVIAMLEALGCYLDSPRFGEFY